jgi:hypothetical protein
VSDVRRAGVQAQVVSQPLLRLQLLLRLLLWGSRGSATTAAASPCAASTCAAGGLTAAKHAETQAWWSAIEQGLGEFQTPLLRRHPARDYADLGGLAAAADHFHRRGVALDSMGEGRRSEAAAAFVRAAEMEPRDSSRWSNAAVAQMRRGWGGSDDDGGGGGDVGSSNSSGALGVAELFLRRALALEPANRLAGHNLQLARVLGSLDGEAGGGAWGGDALSKMMLSGAGAVPVWCEDDHAAARELTQGRHSGCAAALSSLRGAWAVRERGGGGGGSGGGGMTLLQPPIDAPCTQCLRHGDPIHAYDCTYQRPVL